MGSKGSNTTTETKNFTADPRVTQWGNYLMQQGQNLPGQGDVPILGTEGFSPDQLAAFQGVRQAQGTYNPYAQRAEALNAEYGRGLDFERVGDYYNQLSKGPLEQLWAQQRAQMAQGTRNAVQAAGGTGASRIGVAQGNIANQQNLATGALQSNLLGQSVGAFQNDLAMKGAAAAQEANLGMGHTAQNYNDFGQLYGIGSAQQGLGQTKLNNLYQQAQMMYQNPYLNYQFQTGLLPGLSNAFKGTEVTEKEVPEANIWPTLLGGAMSAAGSYFGGPSGGALLTSGLKSLFNMKSGGGAVGMAAGGAVNPYGGGQGSGLFDQMVKEYFPKNNSMVNPAGIKAGNPFGQMVPGQPAFASGGPVNGYYDGGEAFDLLRNRFASDEGQRELGLISRMADERMGEEPASFSQRFDEAPGTPDLYNPEIVANRSALRDAGYNSPYRTEPMSEGDDVAPPLPQARPPFEMFPRNPLQEGPDKEERLAYSGNDSASAPAGGRQLPAMPDTDFQAPERNPYGAIFNAIAAALASHGERLPSGHLKATGFGAALRTAGAGLDAGMKTHAAGREEDRKNYAAKLSGERLAEQAAMSRLPYEQMTEAQRATYGLEAAKPFKIGTDPTTFVDVYGVRDPRSGDLKVIDPVSGKLVDFKESPLAKEQLTGEEYLKSIDPKMAATVRAINEGRIAPPAANSRAPQARALLNHLYAAYPEADTTVWKSRNETRAAFAKGPEGRAVTSLNTVMGHLDDLRSTTERLSSKNVKAWNRIENAIKDQFGQDALADYRVARTAVSDELARVFQGAGVAAESEKQRWLEALDTANSPEQFKRVVGRLASLIQSRMTALESQYDRGMNYEPESDKSISKKGFLDKGAKEKFEYIKKWSGIERERQGAAPKLSPDEAAKAREWIQKNPNDPRVPQLKKLLGE